MVPPQKPLAALAHPEPDCGKAILDFQYQPFIIDVV
jgi:hypothetical protein